MQKYLQTCIIYLTCYISFPVMGVTSCLCLSAKQVRKGKSDGVPQVVPQPNRSTRLPYARPLSIPVVLPLTSGHRSPSPEAMETGLVSLTHKDTPDTCSQLSHLDGSPSGSTEVLSRSVCLVNLCAPASKNNDNNLTVCFLQVSALMVNVSHYFTYVIL